MNGIVKFGDASLTSAFTTIFGLVMDRSGSMARFGDTPQTAINEHIGSLKTNPNAGNAVGFVIAFAEDVQLPIPPQPLASMPRLDDYAPTGCATLLYRTVLAALKELLEMQAKAQAGGGKANIILTVFTDGQDNDPDESARIELYDLSGQALEKGLDLQVIGIGTSGESIAQAMGFPPKCAATIAPEKAAIRHTMMGVTQRTHMTMTGLGQSVPSTPTPPSSR